jgi:hypothetical protein
MVTPPPLWLWSAISSAVASSHGVAQGRPHSRAAGHRRPLCRLFLRMLFLPLSWFEWRASANMGGAQVGLISSETGTAVPHRYLCAA